MKYTTIIFDMDGTLLNTSRGIISCANLTRKAFGLNEVSLEDGLQYIGPPLKDTFVKIFGEDNVETVKDAIHIYRTAYNKTGKYEADIYDGILPLLDYLKQKNVKLVISTLKYEPFAIDIVNHFGFDKYFNIVSGSDKEGFFTKADTIRNTMQRVGESYSEKVLLIGDSEYDGNGALECGIDFLAVTYGFGFREQPASEFNPVFITDIAYEIIDYLKGADNL